MEYQFCGMGFERHLFANRGSLPLALDDYLTNNQHALPSTWQSIHRIVNILRNAAHLRLSAAVLGSCKGDQYDRYHALVTTSWRSCCCSLSKDGHRSHSQSVPRRRIKHPVAIPASHVNAAFMYSAGSPSPQARYMIPDYCIPCHLFL